MKAQCVVDKTRRDEWFRPSKKSKALLDKDTVTAMELGWHSLQVAGLDKVKPIFTSPFHNETYPFAIHRECHYKDFKKMSKSLAPLQKKKAEDTRLLNWYAYQANMIVGEYAQRVRIAVRDSIPPNFSEISHEDYDIVNVKNHMGIVVAKRIDRRHKFDGKSMVLDESDDLEKTFAETVREIKEKSQGISDGDLLQDQCEQESDVDIDIDATEERTTTEETQVTEGPEKKKFSQDHGSFFQKDSWAAEKEPELKLSEQESEPSTEQPAAPDKLLEKIDVSTIPDDVKELTDFKDFKKELFKFYISLPGPKEFMANMGKRTDPTEVKEAKAQFKETFKNAAEIAFEEINSNEKEADEKENAEKTTEDDAAERTAEDDAAAKEAVESTENAN